MSLDLVTWSFPDLEFIVGQVWSTHVADADGLVPAAPHDWGNASGDPAGACWSGAVSVSGEWSGMIAVDLAETSAYALTRGMLGLAEDEAVDPLDLSDAVGELANIVGGNVKSLLPGDEHGLSLPLVAHSVLEAPSELNAEVTIDLAWRGAPVRVRVLALPSSDLLPLSEVIT